MSTLWSDGGPELREQEETKSDIKSTTPITMQTFRNRGAIFWKHFRISLKKPDALELSIKLDS